MDRGASLKWLSIYPGEDEVLYPPLTYLQPVLKQNIRGMDDGMEEEAFDRELEIELQMEMENDDSRHG